MNQFNTTYGGYGQTTLASPSSHLCQFLKKPVIFVIGLSSTVSVLLTLIGEIILYGLIGTLFDSLSPYISSSSEIAAYQFFKNFLSTYFIVILTISTVLALLSSIPYLIMYFRSKGGKKPTGSVTVLQVVSIISLVGACFLVLMALLYIIIFATSASMLSAVSSSSGMYGSTTTSGAVAFIPLMIVIIMLSVLAAINLAYAINYVRLAFSAKSILRDESSKLKGAGFIGVINVISAVFQILGTISSIIMVISVLASPSTAFATARYGSTTIDMLPEIINTLTASLIILCAASVLNCIVIISKAVAAFGAKRHMSYYHGPTQTTPTNYYNDGYSNYDNNAFTPYQNSYQTPYQNTNSTQYGNPYGGNNTNYNNPYYSPDNGGYNGSYNDDQNGGGY